MTEPNPAPAPGEAPTGAPAADPASSPVQQPPAAPDPAGTPGSPPTDPTDWKARFTGLKTLYDKQSGELKGKLEQIQTIQEDLERLKGELSTTKGTATKSQNSLDQVTKERDALKTAGENMQIIMQNHPELVPYVYPAPDEAGQTPPSVIRMDLTGEAFTAHLAHMSKVLSGVAAAAVQAHVAGAAPPAGAPREPEKPLTRGKIAERMMQLDPRNKDQAAEYEALSRALLEASEG